jgi:hypothetical protein
VSAGVLVSDRPDGRPRIGDVAASSDRSPRVPMRSSTRSTLIRIRRGTARLRSAASAGLSAAASGRCRPRSSMNSRARRGAVACTWATVQASLHSIACSRGLGPLPARR